MPSTYIECDRCKATFDGLRGTGRGPYGSCGSADRMYEDARAAGWKITPGPFRWGADNTYRHLCPTCAPKEES